MNICNKVLSLLSTKVFIRTALISFTVMPLAGGLGGLAHPEFGSSVNPILTRGADYAHHITACPPGFENLTASLTLININVATKPDLLWF